MFLSSSISETFNRQAILEFINADVQLKGEYEKLNKKVVQPTHCPLEKDQIPDQNLEKITEYTGKIFKIIQYQAANDRLSVKLKESDRESFQNIVSLPHLKESLLGQALVIRIISQLLIKKLQVAVEVKSNEWDISWEKSNVRVGMKPDYKPVCPLSQVQKETLGAWLKDSSFFDIAFIVEDKVVKAHKVFLSQSPFFQSMFLGEWKEKNSSQPIVIPNFSHQAFQAMLQFFYLFEIEASYFENLAQALELFRLADYVHSDHLKRYCREQIYQRINAENFIDIALLLEDYQDEFLHEICCWYIRKDPNFGQNVDCSHFQPLHLLYKIGKKYQASQLMIRSLHELERTLQLDAKFVELCEFIHTTKDVVLKEWLMSHLRKTHLYAELQEHKKSKYQQQWKVFKKLLHDLSF
jgi:hypothetical protein